MTESLPGPDELTPCECCQTNNNPGFKHGGKCVDCGHAPRSHAHAFAEPLPASPQPMPFDLWWSPSLRRFLARHESQDDEHLVWVFHGHHEALRHYLGTGPDSNPPLPDDAVRLVLADPAQTPGPNKPTHPLPARSYQEVADIVCNLSTLFIAARDRRALTTRAVAQQLDVAPSTVSRLESGFYPSVEVAMRVLEWLEEDCPTCRADAHGLADPAQTTELATRLDETQQKLAEADRLYADLLAQREQWWEHVGRERAQLEAERDEAREGGKKVLAIAEQFQSERDERQTRIDAAFRTCGAAELIANIGSMEDPDRWKVVFATVTDVRAALNGELPAAEEPTRLHITIPDADAAGDLP